MTKQFPERIPPLDEADFTPEQAELIGNWKHLIFSRVMIRNPRMYKTFVNGWLTQVVTNTPLPPHDRQIICLRMLELCGDIYELTHHITISHNTGLTDAQIDSFRYGRGPMTEWDRTVIDAVEQLHKDQNINNDTWAKLSEKYDTEQLIEFVNLAACYMTMGMLTKTFGIQLEDQGGEFEKINTLRNYK